MKKWRWHSIQLAVFLLVSLQSAPTRAEDLSIGVLAVRGSEKAVKRWYRLADYLKLHLPEHSFRVTPLDLPEMRRAVRNKSLHFVLTNTGNFVELQDLGVNCIATLKNLSEGSPATEFGSLVITRFSRSDIKSLRDLKGKRLMGVSKRAFGGFQMVWRELDDLGIDPFRDMKLKFAGLPQDKIVYAVREGVADAGIVRTGTLARMDKEGLVDARLFKIISPKKTGQPFVSSTRTYPEWPFAKTPHVSPHIAKKVALALFNMKETDDAAIEGGYAGWTIPMDYSEVHRLFRQLKTGPYAQAPAFWSKINISSTAIFYAVTAIIVIFGIAAVFRFRK